MSRSRSHARLNPDAECVGRVRRIYVRAGVGRYYVPIGWVCDGCGQTTMDVARHSRMADVKELPADRAELRRQVERTRKRRADAAARGGGEWGALKPL